MDPIREIDGTIEHVRKLENEPIHEAQRQEVYDMLKAQFKTTEDARRQYKNLAEEAIDAYGLQRTLEMIGEICWEKAEHIRANWQDKTLAKSWDKASQIVLRAANQSTIEAISPK